MRSLAGALLCATLLACSASAASAADPWSEPTAVSAAGGAAKRPQVAMGAGGATAVVWESWDANEPRAVHGVVRRDAFSPFGETQELGAGTADAGTRALRPDVAMAPSGQALAAWYFEDGDPGAPDLVDLAFGTASGGFAGEGAYASGPAPDTTVVPFDGLDASGPNQAGPDVALSTSGSAVAWGGGFGACCVNAFATRAPLGATGSVTNLGPGGGNWNPGVAVGADGTALAAWSSDGVPYRLVARSAHGGAAFSSTEPGTQLDGDLGAKREPQVAVAADGRGLVLWNDASGVHYSVFDGTSFGTAQTLRAQVGPPYAQQPALAMDPAGNAVAAFWIDNPGYDPGCSVYASYRPAGGAFETPYKVAPFADCELRTKNGTPTTLWVEHVFENRPRVAMAGDGSAFLTTVSGGGRVQVYRRPAGAGRQFPAGLPTTIPAYTDPDPGIGTSAWQPTVEADDAGNAVVAWSGWDPATSARRIFTSSLTVSEPPVGDATDVGTGGAPQTGTTAETGTGTGAVPATDSGTATAPGTSTGTAPGAGPSGGGTPPEARVTVPATAVRSTVLRRGLVLRLGVPARSSVSVRVTAPRLGTVAALSRRDVRSGRQTLRLRLTSSAARRLRRARRTVILTVRVTITSLGRPPVRTTRKVRLVS